MSLSRTRTICSLFQPIFEYKYLIVRLRAATAERAAAEALSSRGGGGVQMGRLYQGSFGESSSEEEEEEGPRTGRQAYPTNPERVDKVCI